MQCRGQGRRRCHSVDRAEPARGASDESSGLGSAVDAVQGGQVGVGNLGPESFGVEAVDVGVAGPGEWHRSAGGDVVEHQSRAGIAGKDVGDAGSIRKWDGGAIAVELGLGNGRGSGLSGTPIEGYSVLVCRDGRIATLSESLVVGDAYRRAGLKRRDRGVGRSYCDHALAGHQALLAHHRDGGVECAGIEKLGPAR